MTSTRKTSTSKDTTVRATGKFVTRDSKTGRKVDSKTGRVVLFPTEPSRLGKRKIEQAVDRVTSKK
jgi:hypothetical protein